MTQKKYSHTVELHENKLSCSFEVLEEDTHSGAPEVISSGFVKWDGCVNWHAGCRVMVHFCQPSDLQEFMAELQAAIHAAHSLCQNTEKDYWKPAQ
jgi:hypothetical protein